MSIFSSIGGALKGAVSGFLTGGPVGAVIGGAAGLAGGGGGGARPPVARVGAGGFSRLPPININPRAPGRVLPGLGRVAAGGAAGYFAGRMTGYPTRRRSTRGFSARDVRQAKRLMKMLKEVSASAPKPRMVRTSARHCD